MDFSSTIYIESTLISLTQLLKTSSTCFQLFIILKSMGISLIKVVNIIPSQTAGIFYLSKCYRITLISYFRWIEGVGYTYSDLFEPIKGKFMFPKESLYECPHTFRSFINLNLVSLCYALFALYADIVFPNVFYNNTLPFFTV